MGEIRRIDDLGRIVIPRKIRESMMASEGTAFEINVMGKDSILIRKVKEKEKFRDNILYLKNYLKDLDVEKAFDSDSIRQINSKLDDICEIIYFNLKNKEEI